MQARRTASPALVPDVGAGAPGRHQTVEYKVVEQLPSNLEEALNALGEEGWQLVATVPSFIFRRPRLDTGDGLRGPVGFATPRD